MTIESDEYENGLKDIEKLYTLNRAITHVNFTNYTREVEHLYT